MATSSRPVRGRILANSDNRNRDRPMDGYDYPANMIVR